MTKSEIAKGHIKILKEARHLISIGQNEYVCHAIEKITDDFYHPLIQHIEKEIDKEEQGCVWVSSFVKRMDYDLFIKLNETLGGWKTYRLAWLDKWIKDLEAYT